MKATIPMLSIYLSIHQKHIHQTKKRPPLYLRTKILVIQSFPVSISNVQEIIMPMPSSKDVVLIKGVNDSTNDSKKLPQGIWSIKPSFKDVLIKGVKDSTKKLSPHGIKVSPGDTVFLDYIMLTDPTDPSCDKLGLRERIKDKYVCIFMLPMSPMTRGHAKSTLLDAIMLEDVYEHIESSGGKFEVICVPTHPPAKDEKFNYEDNFNPYLHYLEIASYTQFYHINISNNTCLERMENIIGLPNYPEPNYVIVGPEGGSHRRVVNIFDNDFLNWHGAEAYPFTIEKVQQLAREDEALRSGKHDLRTLLSTPDRDFVISNDCTEVPISDLKQKTVCLLFYEDHWECRKRTQELKQVYEAHKDFEVVVVFAITFGHDTSHLVDKSGIPKLEFWKDFRDMPWLAVPFDDPKCRQLWRVFNSTKMCNASYAPKLIIVYSEGKYFEENGFQVLEETKFKRYPFMGKELVQTAVGVRKKTLSSVLGQDVELCRNYVVFDRYWQYGEAEKDTYKVSELWGTPVALLFMGGSGFSEFLSELGSYHSLGRICQGKFEVVYVPMMEYSPDPCSWVLFSSSADYNREHLIPLFRHFFDDEKTQNPEKKFTLALVTFGPFGHYSGQGIMYTNSSEEAYQLFLDTFPFWNDATKEFFETRQCNDMK